MKRTILGTSILFILLFQSVLIAQDFSTGRINVDEYGTAIHGYDPVEYHLTSRAIRGDSTITFDYNGATFYFRNVVNKKIFQTLPERYSPAFGGFCAYGLAFDESDSKSKRGRYKVDPTNFSLYSGKLLLFCPENEEPSKRNWNNNEDYYYSRATSLWAEIKDK